MILTLAFYSENTIYVAVYRVTKLKPHQGRTVDGNKIGF